MLLYSKKDAYLAKAVPACRPARYEHCNTMRALQRTSIHTVHTAKCVYTCASTPSEYRMFAVYVCMYINMHVYTYIAMCGCLYLCMHIYV